MTPFVESSKDQLEGKVDKFLTERLDKTSFRIVTEEASKFLTPNRFDLGFKLAYLYLKVKNPSLALEIYEHDIRAQTLGQFKEKGNEEKNTFQIYVDHFAKTFNSIEERGFDHSKSLIPISRDVTILNGAHRVASAIYLNIPVTCVLTELDDISPDYQYFLDRNVPEHIMDIAAKTICEYADDLYLAFLWPSGRHNYGKAESFFDGVVYKKSISLNSNGALNLLVELYKHMDWVGSASDNFPGVHQKLVECFTDLKSFTVILFKSDSLETVQEIKKRVRSLNDIGFSSIHITDTKEEVVRISKLIFNKNGCHFLNFAKPHKFASTIQMIDSVIDVTDPTERNNLILDGSMSLSVYGLRKALDVDYLAINSKKFKNDLFSMEAHDSFGHLHKVEKRDLIYNPKYFFEYLGLKFVSYEQTHIFKKNRGEEKDINDIAIMSAFIGGDAFGLFLSKSKQYLFYKKLLFTRRFRELLFAILKITKTYKVMRKIYRRLKKLKFLS
jgi:hypothetical protein